MISAYSAGIRAWLSVYVFDGRFLAVVKAKALALGMTLTNSYKVRMLWPYTAIMAKLFTPPLSVIKLDDVSRCLNYRNSVSSLIKLAIRAPDFNSKKI